MDDATRQHWFRKEVDQSCQPSITLIKAALVSAFLYVSADTKIEQQSPRSRYFRIYRIQMTNGSALSIRTLRLKVKGESCAWLNAASIEVNQVWNWPNETSLKAVLNATIEYLRTRQQFGQPIGRFQVLQHRVVDMAIHLEQARSMSYLAAMRCTSADIGERRRALSAAKVVIGDAGHFIGQQAVQLHGGMGMTDDLQVSHWFKRLTAIDIMLGDSDTHLRHYAALSRGTRSAPPVAPSV